MSEINLSTFGAMNESQARAYLERLRWPDGPICPHCAVVNEATKIERHNAESEARDGLYQCRACGEQFTVTVGTVMEGSHLPLRIWLMATHLLCTSKKSLSARQLGRQLGLGSYRTAWFLCHRVRLMMSNGGPQGPMDGHVEADETYMGGKARRVPGGPKKQFKRGRGTKRPPVAVLVSRTGEARARLLPCVNKDNLASFVLAHTNPKTTTLYTDELPDYKVIGRKFVAHHTTSHRAGEYAKPGGITSNTAESYFALLKRGVYGQFHHVSTEHLPRYLDEFSFRWTHRKTSDATRTETALGRAGGVRLYYKQPKVGLLDGGSESLVANG